MHLLKTFALAYPKQSAIMLVALLTAGLVEAVSLTALPRRVRPGRMPHRLRLPPTQGSEIHC